MQDKQQSTSILELLYLIRAKNNGEMTFEQWRESALNWAKGVIAEHEMEGQPDPPSSVLIPSAQADDAA